MRSIKDMSESEIFRFLEKMAIPSDVYDNINDKVVSSLRKLTGETFNIYDFDKVNVGNYEFSFTITDIDVEVDTFKSMTLSPIESGPHVYFHVEIDGTVDLYDSLEDETVSWDVNDARVDDGLWEVEGEISDIIILTLNQILPLSKISNMEMEFIFQRAE